MARPMSIASRVDSPAFVSRTSGGTAKGSEMEFNPIIPETRLRSMREARHWPDRLIIDWHDEAAAPTPDKVALVDHNSTTDVSTTIPFRPVNRLPKPNDPGP